MRFWRAASIYARTTSASARATVALGRILKAKHKAEQALKLNRQYIAQLLGIETQVLTTFLFIHTTLQYSIVYVFARLVWSGFVGPWCVVAGLGSGFNRGANLKNGTEGVLSN